MVSRSWLLASACLFACVDPRGDEVDLGEPIVASLQAPTAPAKFVAKQDGLANEYIVVLKDAPTARIAQRDVDVTNATIDRLASRHAAQVGRRYQAALRGFSARMSEADARALAADPDVAIVEQDSIMRASATETNATQGLDRIDQRNLPLDGNYNFAADGAGVTVFVIDTGLRSTHVEFTGRVNLAAGGTAVDDGNGTEDCNGHGTHVSGTIAGTILGVAKKATIVPIRVLDCNGSGPTSGIIAGIDFVAQNHPAKSVANMSLGGAASDALDASIRNLVASGVTVVVAAGNENQNACNVSPAREPKAITVGATTVGDARASFSNFGTCVDLFGPGVDITSAWIDTDQTINTISGTSMASPHVAGVAALFLSANPDATPAQVAASILASATANKVTDPQGSPNLLLHSIVTAAPPQPPGGSKITSPANGATVAPMFNVTADAANALSVTLAVDGQVLVTDDAAPFAFTVTNAPAGMHTVQIVATFAGGAMSQDAITVTVGSGGLGTNNPPPPPPPTTNDDDGGGGCSATGRNAASAWMIGALFLLLALPRRRHA